MRKVLVVVADTHHGHPFSVPAGPDGWETEDGNRIFPNDWQGVIWSHWRECWQRVADLRKGALLNVCVAGDAVEGMHHGTPQLVTQRIDEQERMHVAAMQDGLHTARFAPRKDRLIYLAGTEAHCGNGNTSTERIARALLQTDELDGAVIKPRLFALVNDVLFDVAHKGYRLGGRAWTRTNSMRAYLTSEWISNLKAQRPMPRYVVRAHNHTYGYASLEDDAGGTLSEAYLAPAWKLKDDYVYSLAPEAVSSIGLLVFVVESNGDSKAYPLLMRCEQDEIEEL